MSTLQIFGLERDRLARLIDLAPGFMCVHSGPEHRITFANRAYLALVGRRDVLGKPVADALPDAVEQGFTAILDRVFKTGAPYTAAGVRYVARVTPDDVGDERFLDFIYQPICDDSGEVTGIFMQGADVTERTRAEAALRRTSNLLNTILEATPSVIYAKNRDGRMQIANGAALALIGRPWSEVKGRTDLETLADPAQAQVVMANDRMVMTSGRTHDVEEWVAAPGDPPRLFLSTKSPWRDEDGQVIGIVGVSVDITDRKRAEAAALESASQFRLYAQTMANHVWTARPDGYQDWVNQRVADYSGMTIAELCGDGWIKMVHPDDLAAAGHRWGEATTTGQPYEVEFRLRRHDGMFRWHLIRAVALTDDAGKTLCWVGTNTDIEEQKHAAQALAHLNQTLQDQVAERTMELMAAEESLRQAQKMEAVGQLTGGIAHDFNNLLTGISGSLEMLEARMAQGRIAELPRYLDAARKAARRAAALTHRLLAFSRRQTLDPKPVELNRLVTEMDELVRRTMGPAIRVALAPAEGLWLTLADPHQLENALLNLCINARDAMPEGGVLTIATRNQRLDEAAAREFDLQAGEYVALCVSDTGSGMPPEVVARAFDPFFTTKKIGEGTGLGLSMIYGFVRQSGGQAKIFSSLEKGTEVRLVLPRFIGEPMAPEDAAPAAGEPLTVAEETVLIVDDEPSVRMLIVEVLEDLGYQALEAEDGPAALEILESPARIDLLITDVGLPGGMNGRQLAEAARRSRPALKVLFISGYAESAVMADAPKIPDMHVMTKPFALHALGSRIKEIMEQT